MESSIVRRVDAREYKVFQSRNQSIAKLRYCTWNVKVIKL